MLIQFSAKNFLSIKDKITFSMLAGAGDENNENLINMENCNERYLKSTAIYGANASGKTNFMKALSAAILMVRRSSMRNINAPLLEMIPFKFDEESQNHPCEFEFIFLKNKIKYIYGFSADKTKIYSEYLYQYLSAKPSLVFERKNVNEYKFTQPEQNKLGELAAKNTEKKLFLSTATEWNYEKTRDAYLWFAEDIDTYSDYRNMGHISYKLFENDKDGKIKKFTLKLLKQADIFIKDYNFEVQKLDIENISPRSMFSIDEKGNLIRKTVRISTIHEVEDEQGNLNEYELDLSEESLGTNNLFLLSPILKETFEKGKVIGIDEIDKSLHPFLVEFIIKLFHNKDINKNNAQLIFNTHNTNLLSLNLFRRDQIWFTEKIVKTGATDLYPLDDYSVRKTENIQKGYLNGRYGGIPFVANGDSLWEE